MDQPNLRFGAALQMWRKRRRLSQLDLSVEAGVSQRHLSFLESGRSAPSRDMALHLAACLDIPLRERNALLLAAGFAPLLEARALSHPDLAAARRAVEAILAGYAPNPALAVDRHWNLVLSNTAVAPLLSGVAPHLLAGQPNVLRLSLHPDGLARRIRNLADWRTHVFHRLARDIDATADQILIDLLAELRAYPVPRGRALRGSEGNAWGGHAFSLELELADGRLLSLLTATTVFGTASDIIVSELAIEAFLPADEATYDLLVDLAQGSGRTDVDRPQGSARQVA